MQRCLAAEQCAPTGRQGRQKHAIARVYGKGPRCVVLPAVRPVPDTRGRWRGRTGSFEQHTPCRAIAPALVLQGSCGGLCHCTCTGMEKWCEQPGTRLAWCLLGAGILPAGAGSNVGEAGGVNPGVASPASPGAACPPRPGDASRSSSRGDANGVCWLSVSDIFFFLPASFPPARWLSLNSATRACLLPAATLRFRYLQGNRIADRYERSGKRLGLVGPASSSTRSRGGSSLWHEWSGAGQARPAARQQPVCPTNGATSPRRPRGGELAELGRGVGAARSGQPRHSSARRPPSPEPRALVALRCRALHGMEDPCLADEGPFAPGHGDHDGVAGWCRLWCRLPGLGWSPRRFADRCKGAAGAP